MNLKRLIKLAKGIHGWSLSIALAIALFMFAGEVLAQNYYDVSLRQRRMGDQIGVEIWVKKANSAAPKIGGISVAVTYNTTFLSPADPSTYNLQTTDSIAYDVNQVAPLPYTSITSGFHSANGYSALAAQASNSGGIFVNQLEVNSSSVPNITGLAVSDAGRGSFVGLLRFNIINESTLTNSTLTNIALNSSTIVGDFTINDINGNNIESNSTLGSTSTMTIQGITLLNPNGPNEAVNINRTFTSLSTAGYPLYFERSGLISPVLGSEYGSNIIAYAFDYSTDGGTTWGDEFMRVAEHRESQDDLNTAVTLDNHRSGSIVSSTGTSAGYLITQGNGTQLPVYSATAGYGGILRVIWDDDPYFADRSERGRIRIKQLNTTNRLADIDDRTKPSANPFDISDENFVLSRLFFLQLDGSTSHLRTRDIYENASQVTVEAWVNLNTITAGTEPGVVATGPGPATTNGQNTEEGAWILYLKDGKYPAFRAREIIGGAGRGENGGTYIADIVAIDALTATSAAVPIEMNASHSGNWVHLAATVNGGTVSLYVNGELKAQTVNTNANDIRMATYKHPVWIGVNPTDSLGSGRFLHAGIKEVKVWRKALSQGELRSYVGGVVNPTTVPANDNRRSLELYYKLNGTSNDFATDATHQNGTNPIYYYTNPSLLASSDDVDEERYPYRPDRAHIKLTSPQTGFGVSNVEGSVFPVRWAAFGLGDITSNTAVDNSADLVLEFSRDGGVTWAPAVGELTAGLSYTTPASLLDQVDVEDANLGWLPYQNSTVAGAYNDLQAIVPTSDNYSKNTMFRVRGSADVNQDNIMDVTGTFVTAPYFALKNTGSTVIEVAGGTDMNLLGGAAMLEAWIRPYRFPTTIEGYFPIINKKDNTTGNTHYALRLLSTGQVQLVVTNEDGTVRTANSDITKPIIAPNAQVMDSVWNHVAVYMNLANGSGASTVKFYIDGTLQSADSLTSQLGSNVNPNENNSQKVYLGYEYNTTDSTSKYFIGELKGIRYWNGIPGDADVTGTEPTDLTNFIRGSAMVRANKLSNASRTNLVASFDMNGGAFVANGFVHASVYSGTNEGSFAVDSINAKITTNAGASYVAVEPYLKLVEPIFQQQVANTTTDLMVRWTGFDFDRVAFKTGDNATSSDSDLEYSVFGGGGVSSASYNPTSSDNDNLAYDDSFTLPLSTTYMFQGVSSAPNVQFAGLLNVSEVVDNAGTQDKISAVKTDARLRLRGRAILNTLGEQEYTTFADLRNQGPLFTITPASNFTVRALLEGYHNGDVTAFDGELGSTFATNGMRIKLYKDANGVPGDLVATSVSTADYASKDPLDPTFGVRGLDGALYGNVNFVFTDVEDGNYFVVLEHQNHLPVMSRYPAPFLFTGDDLDTWTIESGWDFQNWDGDSANVLLSTDVVPATGTKFSAYGNTATNASLTNYGTTGLRYNNGQAGGTTNSISALVGGDVVRDGKINTLDRVQVRLDNGVSEAFSSDVTGEGIVNAIDRTIVDRNAGISYSLYDLYPNLYNGGTSGIVSGDFAKGIYEVLENSKLNVTEEVANEKLAITQSNGEFNYVVSAETNLSEDGTIVSVSMFIENLGKDFAPANCTFGVTFDPNVLQFENLTDPIAIWNDNKPAGYTGSIYSAPLPNAANPIPNLRTIEIDYDAFARLAGVNVPAGRVKIGTLNFSVRKESFEYSFQWHKSTAVLTTKNENITTDGKFDEIRPINTVRTATITTPNGGEDFKAGRAYQVTWTQPNKPATVYVEYSVDNGNTWSRANDKAMDIMTATFDWTTPVINTTEALVRLVDAVTAVEIDRTDNSFSITPAANFITRPSAKDPVYFGGDFDVIKFNVEFATNVRFAFSADGTSNWMPLTSTVNSVNGQVTWKIPTNTNTKNAVVAMYDATNNQFLAVSEPFKVLAGKVAFTSPTNGQSLDGATVAKVKWNSENVLNFDIEFTANNGNNWTSVERNINALKGVHNWTVNNVNTNEGMLRAIYNNDPELEFARTGLFSIVAGSSTGVEEDNLAFELGAAYPNPFNTTSSFSFNLPSTEKVYVELFNAAGTKVADLVNGTMLGKGAHTLVLYGNDLPSGVYFIHVKAGDNTAVQQVVLNK